VFPGQGSQAVGMGKALAEAFAPARAVFAEVDEALGEKLSTLMFEGPEADLTLTANAQPALMAVSLAVTRVLEAEAGLDLAKAAQFVAGHSLGEYSALAAAGAFTIADTARLLRLRGSAMQKAVPVGQGAMAALLGLDYDTGVAVAKQAAEEVAASARSPMTTAAARSSPRARRRRSSGRWRSPRRKAPSAPCCCPSPRPSIAP
jgi:[acyl-carrier-protein] S-malonyltransferase